MKLSQFKFDLPLNLIAQNPTHTNMIVDMWKDWDDNAFDRHNYWADTISVFLSDGTVIKGRDSSMAGAKRYRGSLASAKSTITSIVPLRSADRNEDWVAIWGTETNTMPDGKIERNDIHEIWRINKDGKIDMMKQFIAKPALQQ
jgi:ketosteroid isomerase-like protein